MIEIKSPDAYDLYDEKAAIFLAGSIEMGKAVDWQAEVSKKLTGHDILILNPRRDDWNSSWEQSIDHPQFREQVEWELKALERSNKILMYFAPETKSPITLLEFGLYAKAAPKKMTVCCPEGFWRKGNIDIVCNMYGVGQVETLEDLINAA
ncbi:MAG: nucleoside 2-deoxyribosyltransferase domain-containing protein [Pseudomonadota bacterium]